MNNVTAVLLCAVKACTKIKDGIALGNYDLDIHNPAGTVTNAHTLDVNRLRATLEKNGAILGV